MNVSARRWLLAAAALVVALTLAVACDDTEDEATPAATSSPTSESTPAATGTPASTEAPATETATAAATEAAGTATAEATPAGAADGATVSIGSNADLGEFLVGPDGMTLYIFTNDEPGVSNCTGGCADNWPPLVLESGEPVAGDGVTGELALITRDDGSQQVTYDGAPLYYWANDSAPGDATGHEVGGVWFVARADGSTASAAPSGGGASGNDPGY